MTTKKLTTGYYRIHDWYWRYAWAKTDWPYVRLLTESHRWTGPELIVINDATPVPDLMFILIGTPLAIEYA